MRRAGPCCLLLALACALSRAGLPRSAVRCLPGGSCFSAHLANSSYDEARGACNRRQAGLAWVSSTAELLLLRALLDEALAAGPGPPALIWVGLRRNAPACTDAGQPLRGFSWEGGGAGAEVAPREVPGRWVKEPVKSCITSRCAGLRAAAAPPAESGAGWGWQEQPCHWRSPGYVCRYRGEGACPDLSPAGALRLEYRLPFGESSAGPGFSPPGTELSVACPGGALRLFCRPHSGGFAWEAAEGPLCPCPGRCPGSAGCRDAVGAFACASPAGDGDDGTACSTPGTDPRAPGGRGWRPSTATPVRAAGPPAATVAVGEGKTPLPSPSSSSSNYVFILVTVAVVVLIILVMTVLGVFKLCFDKKSEGRGDKEPPDAGSKAGSAETSGAAGSE